MEDFTFKIGWQCESSIIPFLSKFAPSDEYQIYKHGQDFRVDMTLVAVSKFKSIRGKISLMFKDHQLLLVDYDQGKVKNLMTEPSIDKLEAQAAKLIKKKRLSKAYKTTNFRFLEAKDWRGKAVVGKVAEWTAVKFSTSCAIDLQLIKKPVCIDSQLLELKTFAEYLAYAGSKHLSGSSSVITLSPEVVKSTSKTLKATIWACKEFPLTMKDLLPVVELMSSVSKRAEALKLLLESDEFPKSIGFPVKVVFPVYWTVKAVATFTDFKIGPVDPCLFDCSVRTEEASLEVCDYDGILGRESESGVHSDIVYSDESTAKVQPEYDIPSESEEELARAHDVFMTLSSDSDQDYSELLVDDFRECGEFQDSAMTFMSSQSSLTPKPQDVQRSLRKVDVEWLLRRVKGGVERRRVPIDVDVDM
jgi:hypothetical protein